MSDEDKKVDTDQTGDEDTTKENEDDNKELDNKTLLAQKKHFRDKATKAEEDNKILREKLEALSKEEEPEKHEIGTFKPKSKEDNDLRDDVSLIKFGMKHSDLPSEIIGEAYKISKAEGIDPEEVLEKPYMKLYIEDEARKKVVETAANRGNRSGLLKTEKPIKEMDEDEHKKLWQERNKR